MNNQPIPAFSKVFQCTVDNRKALEAVHNLIENEGAETPARIAFALNFIYGELSPRGEEIPRSVYLALGFIANLIEDIQDAIDVYPAAEKQKFPPENNN